jgi:hypothetical protein
MIDLVFLVQQVSNLSLLRIIGANPKGGQSEPIPISIKPDIGNGRVSVNKTSSEKEILIKNLFWPITVASPKYERRFCQ